MAITNVMVFHKGNISITIQSGDKMRESISGNVWERSFDHWKDSYNKNLGQFVVTLDLPFDTITYNQLVQEVYDAYPELSL